MGRGGGDLAVSQVSCEGLHFILSTYVPFSIEPANIKLFGVRPI